MLKRQKINNLNLNRPRKIDEESKTFDREQLKSSFAYGVVGITILLGMWGIGHSFIKQINK